MREFQSSGRCLLNFLQGSLRQRTVLWSAVLVLFSSFACLGQNASAPAPGMSASTSYLVHPGDVLDINFRWTPEFNQTVTVQPDGHAMLTSAGDVTLGGLTLQQIHDEIVRSTAKKLVAPEVTVTLKDFVRPFIVVAGEVITPGRYELRQKMTALQAILLAGGSKDTAAMSHVLLFRQLNSKFAKAYKLNFGRLNVKNYDKHDMLLQPGDMLLVQRDKIANLGRYMRQLNLGVYYNPANKLF
ncbi:MAG: polysaccharide biosynthesis/export family protein [Acidobacteriaceae bacterium]